MAQSSKDWLGNIRTYSLAWGLPSCAILGGLLFDVPIRTVVWIIALGWMGIACILNARRCGRTHCRFTGPFYLILIIPVFALGAGMISFGSYGWLGLATLALVGSKLIWWATERAWGTFY